MQNTHYYADVGIVKSHPDYEEETPDALVSSIVKKYSDWNSERFPGLAAVYREDEWDGDPIPLDDNVRHSIEQLIEEEIRQNILGGQAQADMECDETCALRDDII